MPKLSKKNSLKPITDDDIIKEQEQHPENEEQFTDNTNLDAYIDMIENTGSKEVLEKDLQIEELNKKLLSAQNKISELENEVEQLKSKLNDNEITVLQNKIGDLDTKNDELLLKNSELEFDINKYKEVIRQQKSEIDTFKKTRTVPKYNPTPNERHIVNQSGSMSKYPKTNGYESWN